MPLSPSELTRPAQLVLGFTSIDPGTRAAGSGSSSTVLTLICPVEI